MSVFTNGSISRTEKLVLIYVFLLLAFGVTMSWVNVNWFNEVYVIEDGFIESLTVLALLIVAFLSGRYAIKLSSKRHWMFTAAMAFLLPVCHFCGG